MSDLESVKVALEDTLEQMQRPHHIVAYWGKLWSGPIIAALREKDTEIARLKAELELARGFMPKGMTLAPPSHEPWRKG